jgi:hypothetical protein
VDAPEELDIEDGLDALVPDEPDPFGTERTDVPAPEGALSPDEAVKRSALAAALLPSMFPAHTSDIVVVLREAGDLDPGLVAAADALPDDVFQTFQEFWIALGEPVEQRDVHVAPRDQPAEQPAEPVDAPAETREEWLTPNKQAAAASAMAAGAARSARRPGSRPRSNRFAGGHQAAGICASSLRGLRHMAAMPLELAGAGLGAMSAFYGGLARAASESARLIAGDDTWDEDSNR